MIAHYAFVIFLVAVFFWFVTRNPRRRAAARRETRGPRPARTPLVYRPRTRIHPGPLAPHRVTELKDMAGTGYAHRESGFDPKPEHLRAAKTLQVHGYAQEDTGHGGLPGVRRLRGGERRAFRARHRAAMRGSRVGFFTGKRRDGGASMTLKKPE